MESVIFGVSMGVETIICIILIIYIIKRKNRSYNDLWKKYINLEATYQEELYKRLKKEGKIKEKTRN